MSTPLLWIGLPLIFAIVLWFLRQRRRTVIFLAAGLSLFLALLAWILPVDSAIRLGPITIEISSTLSFFGRKFLLDTGDKTFLFLIYFIGAFWLFGASVSEVHEFFAPLSLGMIAFLVSALAVQPFLYAALLVEMAVLISIPMLVPPGKTAGQGVFRYLIFQTLGLPFILLAGWAAASVDANPADKALLVQAIVLLGLGFALWLAIFPFYTWVPLLAGETHPYVAGFVLSLLPTVVLLLMLDFLNEFNWLRIYPLLPAIFSLVGAIMVVTGGVWAAFQRDLTRLFGYAVIMESGFSLLALGLGSRTGFEIYAGLFLPRMLALALWALTLSIMTRQVGTAFDNLNGLLRRFPLTSSAFLVAYFSLGGLPLLAGFPTRQVLMESIAQHSLGIALWAFIGNLGFLLSGFRVLAVLVKDTQSPWQLGEEWPEMIFLAGGIVALLLIGIFPHFFLSGTLNLLNAFERLQ